MTSVESSPSIARPSLKLDIGPSAATAPLSTTTTSSSMSSEQQQQTLQQPQQQQQDEQQQQQQQKPRKAPPSLVTGGSSSKSGGGAGGSSASASVSGVSSGGSGAVGGAASKSTPPTLVTATTTTTSSSTTTTTAATAAAKPKKKKPGLALNVGGGGATGLSTLATGLADGGVLATPAAAPGDIIHRDGSRVRIRTPGASITAASDAAVAATPGPLSTPKAVCDTLGPAELVDLMVTYNYTGQSGDAAQAAAEAAAQAAARPNQADDNNPAAASSSGGFPSQEARGPPKLSLPPPKKLSLPPKLVVAGSSDAAGSADSGTAGGGAAGGAAAGGGAAAEGSAGASDSSANGDGGGQESGAAEEEGEGAEPAPLERAADSPLVILDVRSFFIFNRGHIGGAYNVSLPRALTGRAQQSLSRVESLITEDEGKQAFRQRAGRVLVIYDDERETTGERPANALARLLMEEKSAGVPGAVAAVYMLDGGFAAFVRAQPALCTGSNGDDERAGRGGRAGARGPSNKLSLDIPEYQYDGSAPVGLDPISEIIPKFIYLGSDRNAASVEDLTTCGIRYILNVAKECDNHYPGEYTYKNININDDPDQDLEPYIQDATDFIVKAKREGVPILVHCYMGISRSATLVMCYLMSYEGYTLKDAYDFLREKRPKVCPNSGFMAHLIRYERRIYGTCSLDQDEYAPLLLMSEQWEPKREAPAYDDLPEAQTPMAFGHSEPLLTPRSCAGSAFPSFPDFGGGGDDDDDNSGGNDGGGFP